MSTLKIPTAEEIPVRDYIKFYNEAKGVEDSNEKLRIALKFLLKVENVEDIPLTAISEVAPHLEKALSVGKELVRSVVVGGKKLKVIPDLSSISFGEFIDLDSSMMGMSEQNVSLFLSTMYREVKDSSGEYYNLKKERATVDMLDVPVSVYLGAVGFFLTLSKQLSSYLAKYGAKWSHPNPAGKAQDGLTLLMHSLEEMLQNGNKLLIYPIQWR